MSRYYILDSRQVVGNCVMWWRPDGAGYTCDLADAGLYEEGDTRGSRETDVRVPEEVAKACSYTHVRIERLRDALDALGVQIPAPTSGAHSKRRR